MMCVGMEDLEESLKRIERVSELVSRVRGSDGAVDAHLSRDIDSFIGSCNSMPCPQVLHAKYDSADAWGHHVCCWPQHQSHVLFLHISNSSAIQRQFIISSLY